MTDKICHLCGVHYEHSPEECLDALHFRLSQAEINLSEIGALLARAKKEYFQLAQAERRTM